MLKNAREIAACRREIAGLARIKRGIDGMAKNFSVDATELHSVLDHRVRLLSSQLEKYQALEFAPQNDHTSLEALSVLTRVPSALIEARIALGWRQSDLAKHAQMKQQQISRYEKTMYSNITLAKAIAIAQVLTERSKNC